MSLSEIVTIKILRWSGCTLLVILLGTFPGNPPAGAQAELFQTPWIMTSLPAELPRPHLLPRPLSAGEQTTLHRRCQQRLPQFEPLFREVARQHEMEWTLLAAMAYQESHWHPKAKSPTGVRGLMMLTRKTAREVGIHNRLDPEQSLRGGVHYLRKLHQRLPEEIVEPDRTWMAMAAYNVGYGHLQDARELARKHQRNPNYWHDVMTVLPLLEDPDWHGSTRYGYARGREPVNYVEQIRSFSVALNQMPAASKPSSAPGGGGKKG